MSLWLNLIPQLHRPGEGDDFSMRHHHMEEGAQYYDGMYPSAFPVFPQIPLANHVTFSLLITFPLLFIFIFNLFLLLIRAQKVNLKFTYKFHCN